MSNAKKNENKEKVLINAPFPFSVAMTGKNLQRKLIINQNLKPVNPLQCGRQACPSGYSYSSGERYYWLLHFVISGKGALMNRSGRHPVRENEMFVIRPFESVTYTADVDEPWEYIWIGFTSETPVPPILECGDVIRAPYLKELFISAYENGYFENMDTHGAYEHYLCGVIWQIFGVLLHNTKRCFSRAN